MRLEMFIEDNTEINNVIQYRKKKAILKDARAALLKQVFLIAVICVLIFLFVIGGLEVKGNDMSPAINDKDLVFYYRLAFSYTNDDIIIYKHDGKKHVGRICATEGALIGKTQRGQLTIDQRIQPIQKRVHLYYQTYARNSEVNYPFTVPEKSYFVLGDKRDTAKDSRDYFCISKKDVCGKVFTVIRRGNL